MITLTIITCAIAKIISTDLIASTVLMYAEQIPVTIVAHASTRARISTLTHVSVLMTTLETTAKIQVIIKFFVDLFFYLILADFIRN